MKTTTATLHHLGFSNTANYGLRVIEVPLLATQEEMAEYCFVMTNHPAHKPVEISREGQCYSLSVGDVVELSRTELLIVLGCGFQRINHRAFYSMLGKRENALELRGRYDMIEEGLADMNAFILRHPHWAI